MVKATNGGKLVVWKLAFRPPVVALIIEYGRRGQMHLSTREFAHPCVIQYNGNRRNWRGMAGNEECFETPSGRNDISPRGCPGGRHDSD